MTNPILELRSITKSFGELKANDCISLKFQKGKIHALLGENGAGKTTLMNILYGLYQPDEGEIYIDGSHIQINEPRDAIQAGLGMVHQHFMLAPVLTVTENVMVGFEDIKNGFVLDRQTSAAKIKKLSEQHGLEVDPDEIVQNLPVGIQQRVEIIKLLYREADTLILDEPTAVLTPQETDQLFEILQSLVAKEKTIIFITHKLKEALNFSDTISVLRRGKVVTTTTPDQTDERRLAEYMVGRDVELTVSKGAAQPGNVYLETQEIIILDDRHQTAVDGISFSVRAGEILGIAGVQGNGQTELVEAITGLRSIASGNIWIDGQCSTTNSPRQITELGVGHIPEDRQRDGLVLDSPISTNMVLCSYYLPPFAKGVQLQFDTIDSAARKNVEKFDVRTSGIKAHARTLSGGNQQKLIVARELSRPLKLLVASQPTRGLDVGSLEFVHKQIVQMRDEGVAVLLISTELDEILALSDRIVVMFEGKITRPLGADQNNKEQLGLLMAGVNLSKTATEI